MFVLVNSKSADSASDAPGKTSWVNCEPDIKLLKEVDELLGEPPWFIELYAEETFEKGYQPGVNRVARVRLTPRDVARLLKVIGRAGVLSVDADGWPDRPW